MALIWAAYTHTVHYLVNTEDESIDTLELPGWMNEYHSPDVLWEYDGTKIDPYGEVAEEVIKILESAPLPDRVQT